MGRVLVWSGSELGQVAGCCEHGNGHRSSIKCGEISDYMKNLIHRVVRRTSRQSLGTMRQMNSLRVGEFLKAV